MTDKDNWTHLESRVTGLETDVSYIGNTVKKLSDKIDDMINQLSRSNKTDWTTLGTWAAVLLVLVGMWTMPMSNRLDTINKYLDLQQVKDEDSLIDRAILKNQMEYNDNTHNRLIDIITKMDEEIDSLNIDMGSIKSNRYTSAQGSALEARLSELEHRVEIIREEQKVRTNKVYKE